MIKFSKKSTLTKTLILVMVSALMLSTSTYAWFNAGTIVSVDQIIANFESPSSIQTFTINEAIDANYNGERDLDEPYVPISGSIINVSQMQPGKLNFYKMEVLVKSGKSASVLMKNIQINSDGGLSDQTILENIKVRVKVDKNNIGGTLTTTTLWDLIPNPGTEGPYTATLATNVTSATIYFDVGIEGADVAIHNNEAFQNATSLSCSIGFQAQSAT